MTSDLPPLRTRWPAHTDDEIAAVADVLRSGAVNYWTGVHGQTFESEVSRAWGIRQVLAVSNGTTALECVFRGLGLHETRLGHDWPMQPQVIVPARTFVATASAVHHAGGVPVLADVDPATLCVTAETVAARETGATVGVVVVHYGGLPCPDMDEIVRLCMRKGWWLVEDAAHAHGAPGVGLMSHATAWSMCAGKIMSSGGEGGIVGCLDTALADRMRAYRDHGRYQLAGRNARDMSGAGAAGHGTFEYCVEEPGSNLRMTEMQAVLARSALRRLPEEIARRRAVAARYDAVLDPLGRALFTGEQRERHVRYLYHARCARGDKARVVAALNDRGVPARFGGCDNIGKEPGFIRRGWNQPCPGADMAGETTFSLPVYPTMSDEDVARVCEALRAVLG
jgi:dTDP-4-amino-4,6-dideoxygalactose transaminase